MVAYWFNMTDTNTNSYGNTLNECLKLFVCRVPLSHKQKDKDIWTRNDEMNRKTAVFPIHYLDCGAILTIASEKHLSLPVT